MTVPVSLSNRPLLLTGAAGFLGAWVARRALQQGRQVVACDLGLDRRRFLQIAERPDEAERIDWRTLDVTDAEAVAALVAETRPHALLHLAALQIPACAADPGLGARVNLEGHINVLEAARHAGGIPVVYASSAAAKPRGPDKAPANLYGIYKQAGEGVSRLYWRDHGVPSIGLRPYVVYGVGRDQGETSAFTAAMQAAAEGRPFELPFGGHFCFQYAADVADLFLGCAEALREGASVSDVSGELHSVDDLQDAILTAVPEARIAVKAVHRPGPDGGFDITPLEALLGPQETTSLHCGVAETIRAFRRLAASKMGPTQTAIPS